MYCDKEIGWLLHAIFTNDHDETLQALNAGAYIYLPDYIDSDGNNCLMIACALGNEEIVELLLESVIMSADVHEYVNLTEFIHRMNFQGETALIITTKYNHTKVAELLLHCMKRNEALYDTINTKHGDGIRALHIAQQMNYVEIVQLLAQFGIQEKKVKLPKKKLTYEMILKENDALKKRVEELLYYEEPAPKRKCTQLIDISPID